MKISPFDLRQVAVFERATDEDLRVVLQHAYPRNVEESGYFFMQGDPAAYVHILSAGQVKLLQANPAGQQVNLRTIYPWQLFGALGAVRDQATYPASAEALEDSSSLSLEATFLRRFMGSRSYLSWGLMQLMTSYIQEMQSRYRELATEKVEQRIARVVLRLAAQSGQRVEDGIELGLTRQDLAEISGSTLYTVSRVLADWDRRGLVDAGREQVKIKKPHDFVRIAEGL